MIKKYNCICLIALELLAVYLNDYNIKEDTSKNFWIENQNSFSNNISTNDIELQKRNFENTFIEENSHSYTLGEWIIKVYWRLYEAIFLSYRHLKNLLTNTVEENLILDDYHQPCMEPGRQVIVHLFEWKWDDIAKECRDVLGPNGFGGVQISPPAEHAILWEPWWNNDIRRAWFERYRPVSYNIITRSGDEKSLQNMIHVCNTHQVRVFVDVVLNHMTGFHDKVQSTGESNFNPSIPFYGDVPYGPKHFNSRIKCGTASGDIEDITNVFQLRNCRLMGLNDLDQSNSHVRRMMINYLNKLISLGVAGFRIDAAKHMWPSDLKSIYRSLDNLNEKYFPLRTRPFIYQEVINEDSNDPINTREYTFLGRVTEFQFGIKLADILHKTDSNVLSDVYFFGDKLGMLRSHNAFVFIDNHDTQRGHGITKKVITYREPRLYKIAIAFMLAWPYGIPRIMSSYDWTQKIDENENDVNSWIGPPHDSAYNILSVTDMPDGSCGNDWICEHRWKEILNMIRFNQISGKVPVSNWWSNGRNQIAFGRENRAFIAINNEEDEDLDFHLQTGLPPGIYCDIITGYLKHNSCTGRVVIVTECGNANVFISTTAEVPIIAIHIKETATPRRL
ncbi:alpha-amylase 2B-like isoform X3 [Centruroides sculpturatus]|uniref:alpha-amylase 2B-like isoform X3 n=1 Tax=Centruroides sculpturatus TaxID=218467 RepID=UPI000C6CD5C1|nr:alpha-amylase 2B-like isoform X3 [Centruroides sculpturatus]